MKRTILILLAFCLTLMLYINWDKSPSQDQISQSLKNWESSNRSFDYDGHKLAYHDTGGDSSKVLILLHGYPTSSYDWHLVWEDLKKEYHLIAMDMLGFGFSDKPTNIDYATALQTDILLALLKELKINDIHILAQDYGDHIAQELLARNLENPSNSVPKISSVSLLNGGLFPETHQPTSIQKLFKSPIGGFVSSLLNFNLFKKRFAAVFGENTSPSNQELMDLWYIIYLKNGHQINHKLSYATDDCVANRTRWVNGLNTGDIPIQFINGQSDPVSGKETADRYKELVKNANVIRLENIGHYPQLECPDLVNSHLRSFIDQL